MTPAHGRPEPTAIPDLDPSTMSSECLSREIGKLSGDIAAATCRVLLYVAEFDRREAWADWGCLSCANWLAWKCGMSPGAAREHVRVARRLVDFPQLIGPFSTGQISFSKVRAIVRVATQANIAVLVEMADLLTAAQLESLTAAYKRVARTIAAEITGVGHSKRFARWRYDEDGSVLICARLDPEEGAVVVKALEAAIAADETDVSAESRPEPETDVSAESRPEPETDVSAESRPEPETDVSAESRPELLEVTAPTGERHPPETKNADALLAMAQGFLEKGAPAGPPSARYEVVLHVDEDSLMGRAPLSLCEIEGGHIVMPETARRLSCDTIVLPLVEKGGKPLAYGRRKRMVPPPLRRALEARDKGCRFPGCNRKRVDAHHIEHWVEGGETNPENLVSLCRSHHRLVHEGGFKVKVTNGHFRFYRPDDVHLSQVPREPIPDSNDLAALRRQLGLTAATSGDPAGNWDGESLTFDVLCDCVDALLLADGLTTRIVEKLRDEYQDGKVVAVA